jgi:hypothetical protein
MKTLAILAALLAAPAAAPAEPPARAPERGEEVRIPAARFGGIRNFHAVDDDVVYIQDRKRNWYRAELAGHCWNLRSAMAIGIDTRGSGSFDRFSAIVVGHDRCPLVSLVASDKPPRRRARRQEH